MKKLNWGMIGGGEGSQIGPAHRLGAQADGNFTLAAVTTPDGVNNGRTEQDFTDCQKSFHVFSLTNFDASFKLYEKLFLEMATSEKDHWVYRRSNVKNFNPSFYHLGGVISTFYMYYAVNYEAFNYTKKERSIIENYFKKKAFAERFNLDGNR